MQVTNRASRDEQLALARRALELEPDYAYAHAVLARVLWTNVYTSFSRDPEPDTAEAVASAERAAALAPDNAEILGMCVSVHLSLGNAVLGLELAERAYRISPVDTFLFNALNHNGRSSEVIERASGLTTIPNALTHRYVYSACMIEGKHELGLEWAQKAVGAMPDNYMAWMELANALALLNRLEESREAVARAKSIVPRLKFALYEKGLLISYRHKAELVAPQVAGLRKLGIE
jgi:adenylate cyclase